MPVRRSAGSEEHEVRYKALQTEKASYLGGRRRIPVCKGCYEDHLRCPGPAVDNNGNYDYSKKCLRCIDFGGLDCDFESKMSALPRRSLAVMTEEELNTVMKTNKEMGRMHPREVSMNNICQRRIDANHFRNLPSDVPASQGARGLQSSTLPSSAQPITAQSLAAQPSPFQPSLLILPDGRLVEYRTQPTRLALPDGRVIEYTIIPAEPDEYATSEQAYEAAYNEIAQAIQQQEDRRMQLRLPLPSMYQGPFANEQAPAN